jgi:hypothetical protein
MCSLFDTYYQQVIPPSVWPEFNLSMLRKLPVSFRVNGIGCANTDGSQTTALLVQNGLTVLFDSIFASHADIRPLAISWYCYNLFVKLFIQLSIYLFIY